MKINWTIRCKLCGKGFDHIGDYKEHIPRCDRQKRIRELTQKAFMRNEEAFRRLAEND